MHRVSETATAVIEVFPEGTVVTRVRERALQRLPDAKENIAHASAACAGAPKPLLVDMRKTLPLDEETRHYYSGRNLTDHFTAIGLLVQASAFGRMMGNIYLRIAKPSIPSRLFVIEDEARAWLRTHLR